MAKKFTRKTKKRYDTVTFKLDYIDGTFELPKFTQLPSGLQRKLVKGDTDPMYTFIAEHAGQEVVDIMDELSLDEITEFMEAWSTASGVELGK